MLMMLALFPRAVHDNDHEIITAPSDLRRGSVLSGIFRQLHRFTTYILMCHSWRETCEPYYQRQHAVHPVHSRTPETFVMRSWQTSISRRAHAANELDTTILRFCMKDHMGVVICMHVRCGYSGLGSGWVCMIRDGMSCSHYPSDMVHVTHPSYECTVQIVMRHI